MTRVLCPALILAAPSSSQGKTTITAASASMLSKQGKIVRVFKVGPDYLDPQILRQASGQPVEPLDLWMGGTEYCQQKMYEAALVADIILIEGAMGIFDGDPSSADLAAHFGIPIAIVMDVKGMAQTAAAIAVGLANFRDDFNVAGLIANNCGSERHAQLIRDALPASLPLLGTLKRTDTITLPERHLGLVQAEEIQAELKQKLAAGIDWIEASDLKHILDVIKPVEFHPVTEGKLLPIAPVLTGKIIAIAKDTAFSFIYDANLRLLTDLGASYVFFSPMHDDVMPEADALWLPGGYPELHVDKLTSNLSMLQSIRNFAQTDKAILAECGGFLYCLESLGDLQDNSFTMLGLLKGKGQMRERGGCQGMQTAPLPEGDIRGHSHHRSLSFDTPEPIATGRRPKHPAPGESIYRVGNITASYLHLFFPSNPQAIAALFKEL
ncbi:cobyrinate a,c-diamide synthase [Moritella viscosa]|uniref:Cobyrinic acid a,c-diamide synthase n=1 Tax=Moritella viscosa TaxID=80854 RepID=A0A1K9ZIV2_9GAMM|nr:cobyrinate a,c-diamide synthase [Moritella viscosa]SGY97568.1 Cobyrinic acid a,c-diamide synthase [Moritella viscosa]